MRAVLLLTVASLTIMGCDKLKPAPSPAAASNSPYTVEEPQKPLAPVVGRYTIIHSPEVERDTMLLDTATGDTWQLVNLGKGDKSGLGWQFTGKIDQPPKNSN